MWKTLNNMQEYLGLRKSCLRFCRSFECLNKHQIPQSFFGKVGEKEECNSLCWDLGCAGCILVFLESGIF